MVYEFRVAPENRAGVGPASDPIVPIQFQKKDTGEAPELVKPLTNTIIVMPKEVTLECEISEGSPRTTRKSTEARNICCRIRRTRRLYRLQLPRRKTLGNTDAKRATRSDPSRGNAL